MKIMFVDIDGVLNNTASAAEGVDIIPEKMVMLRRLCEMTGARIVISSSWRILVPMHELQYIFRITGLRQIQILDATPRHEKGMRGHEIQAWLDDHPEVTQYVIFDDDADMLPQQYEYFIKTDCSVGLTYEEWDKAFAILGPK